MVSTMETLTIRTENKFRTLVTKQAYKKGEVICTMPSENIVDKPTRFTVQISKEKHTHVGKLAALNHSCNPNAGLSGQICLIAMRDINVGEEVCFDYAMSDSSDYDEFECHCGAPNCRKKITGNDWKLLELHKKYEGYFIPYLQRRIQSLYK